MNLVEIFGFLIISVNVILHAQSDVCSEEKGEVTLSTNCPDICSSEGICILYPSTTKCVDAAFGECQTYNVHEQQCQVHCVHVGEDKSSLSLHMKNTSNDSMIAMAPIAYVSKLILPSRISHLHLIGDHKPVSLHPQFLSASNQVKLLQIWASSTGNIPKGALPLGLELLELAGTKLLEEPGDIPYLSEITELYLKQNLFTDIPRGIFELNKLEKFAIQQNKITQVILTKSEFDYFKNIPRMEIDPIVSLNCPSYTTPKTWTQAPLLNNALEVAQEEMEHRICLVNDNSTDIMGSKEVENTREGNNEKNNILPTAFIVLIVASIICFIIMIIFLIRWYRERKKSKTSMDEPLNPFHQPDLEGITIEKEAVYKELECNKKLAKARLIFQDIHFIKKLSSGGFGAVYKAKYQDQIVAVKTLLPQESKKMLSSSTKFADEIEFTMGLCHRSIVHLIGVAWSNIHDLCAVVEFMDRGDLHQVLASTSPLEMSWKNEKWTIMASIAEALLYLHSHSPPIIHRDLKSRNVLLDSVKGTKLSDFGLSRYRKAREDETSMTSGVGTVRWMAPEMFRGENYTEKVDIYAFGLILVHLSTHQLPFEHLSKNSVTPLREVDIMYLISSCSASPSFGQNCPPCISELGEKCLDSNIDLRPTSDELVEALHGKLRYELQKWIREQQQ